MRDDMFEVIIERPRWGSRMRHRRRAQRIDAKVAVARDPDQLPSQFGLRRWADLGTSKSLSENLAPLRRYLETQVNRPWDKVWSDISANLATGSTVQQHVRGHVGDFVAITTSSKDGIVQVHDHYGRIMPLNDTHYRLYVDPRTGLLRRNKHYKSWDRKARDNKAAAERYRATRMRELAPDTQLHRFDDGAWWEVKLAAVPSRLLRPDLAPVVDVVYRARLSRLAPFELYGRPDVYAVRKRQLSRREIVDLGLPRR
jgi:hypothetical protein